MKNIQKSGFKGFVAGVALTAVLAVPFTAMAQSVQKLIPVTYNDIKVKLNGETVTLKDVDGIPLEPLNYEGSVYVPIRGVSESLGMNVSYDEANKTVVIVGNTAAEAAAPVTDTEEKATTDNSATNTENNYSSDDSASDGTNSSASDDSSSDSTDSSASDDSAIDGTDSSATGDSAIDGTDSSATGDSAIDGTDSSATGDSAIDGTDSSASGDSAANVTDTSVSNDSASNNEEAK